MKTLYLNPDTNYVRNILKSIESKNGYCCCQILQNNDSICPYSYDNLPNQITTSLLCGTGIDLQKCVCQLYK